MPIDINLLREDAGNDPNVVRKSEEQRFRDPVLVDQIIEIDVQWRKLTFDLNKLKKEHNDFSKEIGKRIQISKGQDKCEFINDYFVLSIFLFESNLMKQNVDKVEKELAECSLLRTQKLNLIGNIVHTDVPVSKDENLNQVTSEWGQIPDLKVDGKTLGHIQFQIDCLQVKYILLYLKQF